MIREINIRAVLNGFVVQVGCQIVVFSTVDTLIANLGAYLEDPDGVEGAFLKRSINASKISVPQEACPPADPLRSPEPMCTLPSFK